MVRLRGPMVDAIQRRAAAAAIAAALLAASLPAPARADDRQDCERNSFETRIAACTRLAEQTARLSNEERARAISNRGRAYLARAGHERLAIADFEAARQLVGADTSDAALYQGLGALAARQVEQAITTFGEALRREPANAGAHVARAAAYRNKGAFEQALADYEAALRLNPRHAVAYSGRGAMLAQRKEHERAIGDFDAALAIDPTYALALRMRALAKSELGRLDAAIADYDATIRLDAQLASAFNGRGHVYFKKGEHDRAFQDFDTALRLDPTLSVGYANRAIIHARRGNVDAAIADYERLLALPALSADDRNRQQIARERIARLRAQAADAARRATPGAPPAHKRVALVIGNAKYQHVPVLANPINDARAVAAAFRRLGFTSVTEVTDTTRDQLAKALQTHGDLSGQAEWSVVFFAGHGIEIAGMSYLIPIDAALKRDSHVEDEAIGLARVMAKVDGAQRIGLVILDACRDNPFVPRMVRSAGGTRSVGAGLAAVEPDGNVLVAYAARHGTVAQDGAGKNSPFTEALLAHIEEPGLEVSLLFRRIRDTVRRKTERRQDPFVYGSLGSEPIYLRSASAR